MSKRRRWAVVTTDKDRRGVFMGELVSHDIEASTVELCEAHMIVYWSAATRGVMGLAANGPQSGSRVTPSVPRIHLNGVTSVIDASEKAVELCKAQPWAN